MMYAARHPDLFSAAGSFSGAVDLDLDWPAGPLATKAVENLPDGRKLDQCIWGNPVTQEVNWQNHDRTELAGNLADVDLYVAAGTGAPDTARSAPSYSPAAGATEQGVFQESLNFVQSLREHGQPPGMLHENFYAEGTHEWYYWRKDLAQVPGTAPDGR